MRKEKFNPENKKHLILGLEYLSNPQVVEYDREKPMVDNYDPEIGDGFKKHFLTKGINWSYEQEERVIDYLRGNGIHQYNRKILKSVIAGMRMNDEDFKTLSGAVNQVNNEFGLNITVHKAESVKGKFALFVPDRPDLNVHNLDN